MQTTRTLTLVYTVLENTRTLTRLYSFAVIPPLKFDDGHFVSLYNLKTLQTS